MHFTGFICISFASVAVRLRYKETQFPINSLCGDEFSACVTSDYNSSVMGASGESPLSPHQHWWWHFCDNIFKKG